MRRLVYTSPVRTLGPYRESSGKGRLFGPLFVDLVHFVSTKHRIDQPSARAIVNTVFEYIAAETLKNNETFHIPRFGNIRRGKNQAHQIHGSGPTLLISRNSLTRKFEHFDDPEDAGPRFDEVMPPGKGGIHEDDVE